MNAGVLHRQVLSSNSTTSALAWAVVIEVALVALLALGLMQSRKLPDPFSTPLSIDLSPEPMPEPPAPAVVPPPAVTKPLPQRVENKPMAQVQTPAPEPIAPAPVLEKTSPIASPAPSPQPAPRPAVATVDPLPAYNAKLAAAVQAAFQVPAAATALEFKGKARLEFSLKDGVALSIRILQSSGLSAVDRAAIKAVEMAKFPPPPPALLGRGGVYQIWVECF